MPMMEQKERLVDVCVGLFGTCGGSHWRDPFMEAYQRQSIKFYNPQVADWRPELAAVEAHHLANDAVILFPVTGETYGSGSLAECGFSIVQAIRLDDRRDFVILIDRDLDPSLNDTAARKESLRARALVGQHLRKLNLPNVYVVDTLPQMLQLSVTLYRIAEVRFALQEFNPQNRPPLV